MLQRARRAADGAADALAAGRVDVDVVVVVLDLPQRVEAELVEPADLRVDDPLLVAAVVEVDRARVAALVVPRGRAALARRRGRVAEPRVLVGRHRAVRLQEAAELVEVVAVGRELEVLLELLPLLVGDRLVGAAAPSGADRAAAGEAGREHELDPRPRAGLAALGLLRLVDLRVVRVDPRAHVGALHLQPGEPPSVALRVVGGGGAHDHLADAREVGGAGRRDLGGELVADRAGAGQRGGVSGRLGAGAQYRGAADPEGEHAERQNCEHQHDQPGQDLARLPP